MKNPLDAMGIIRDLYAARHEPENIRPLGELVWRILLVLIACAIVGIVWYAVVVFWNVVGSLNSVSTASSKPPVVLDKNSLDAAVRLIETRKSEFEAAKSNPRAVVEPSK